MTWPLVGSFRACEVEEGQEAEHPVKRSVTVQFEHYRGYQIETRDPREGGWIIAIYSPAGIEPAGAVLRSADPRALADLLSAARLRIDAALAKVDPGEN